KYTLGKDREWVINRQIKSIIETINKFQGRVVKHRLDYFLISFDSVTNAVQCALKIQAAYNQRPDDQYAAHIELKIGLSAGVPVSEKEGIFEDTIQMAERLCDVVKGPIAVSSEVKDL